MARADTDRIAREVCTPEQLAALNAPDDEVSRHAILANVQYVHFGLFVIAALLLLILWRVW